jgi:hypothetical protein
MDALFRSRSLAYRAAAGNDYRTSRNYYLTVLICTDIFSCRSIEDRCRGIYDDSCTDHRILLHDCSFVYTAVSADEYIILNDDRQGTYRFKNATELLGSREMDMLSDLGT